MKKFLAALLAIAMILSLTACGEKKEERDLSKYELKGSVGMLINMAQSQEDVNELKSQSEYPFRVFLYDDLTSMLLATKAEKVLAVIAFPEIVGQYISARDTEFKVSAEDNEREMLFSMATLKEKTEVFELLDKVIKDMKEDGSLESLKAEYLNAFVEDPTLEPEAVAIPEIAGADTIKIAVTGDVPPIDFITADGAPAGFNIALLSEISKRANVNIELVNITAAARTTALSAGSVDAVFWVSHFADETDPENAALLEHFNITEPYFDTVTSVLELSGSNYAQLLKDASAK